MPVIIFLLISAIFFLYTFTDLNVGKFYFKNYYNQTAVWQQPKKLGQEFNINLTAKSALAIDDKTQTILYSKNPTEIRPLASLTKLMTAVVFLKTQPDWNREITIQNKDFINDGSRYLEAGDKLILKDLFRLAVIGSDNVAITALVNSTTLTQEEFVDLMNQQARLWGLEKTKFIEPTGLSPENVSTAGNLMVLAKYAFNYQEIIDAANQDNYQITFINSAVSRTVSNTNKLLLDLELKSIYGKTGYLVEAGYNLVSYFDQDNKKILIIILGADQENDRFSEAKSLALWVYQNFVFY